MFIIQQQNTCSEVCLLHQNNKQLKLNTCAHEHVYSKAYLSTGGLDVHFVELHRKSGGLSGIHIDHIELAAGH